MGKLRYAAAVITLTLAMLLWGGTLCYAADRVDFTYKTDGKILEIYIKDFDKSCSYQVSMNGGKNYIPVSSDNGFIKFKTLPAGTYQLRARKTGDDNSVSDIQAAVLGKSNISEGNEIKLAVSACAENGYKNGKIHIKIIEPEIDQKYVYSINNSGWTKMIGSESEIEGLIAAEYNVKVRSLNSPEKTSRNIVIKVPPMTLKGGAYISVTAVKQLPELPTGCEVTSLAMALNYYGLNIPKTILADFFLPKAEYRTADYRKYFIGNPREIKAYGCYADVIAACAEKYLDTVKTRSFDINNITGCDPDQLYSYLDMNYPVIVWATGNLSATKVGPSWIDRETGKTITWVGNEHCMLLTGYNKKAGIVWVNDPMKGAAAYDMKLFEQRFEEMEKQAIIIVETTDPK